MKKAFIEWLVYIFTVIYLIFSIVIYIKSGALSVLLSTDMLTVCALFICLCTTIMLKWSFYEYLFYTFTFKNKMLGYKIDTVIGYGDDMQIIELKSLFDRSANSYYKIKISEIVALATQSNTKLSYQYKQLFCNLRIEKNPLVREAYICIDGGSKFSLILKLAEFFAIKYLGELLKLRDVRAKRIAITFNLDYSEIKIKSQFASTYLERYDKLNTNIKFAFNETTSVEMSNNRIIISSIEVTDFYLAIKEIYKLICQSI